MFTIATPSGRVHIRSLSAERKQSGERGNVAMQATIFFEDFVKACKTPYQNFIQPQLIIKSAREASSVTVQQPAERVLV